MIFFIRLVTSYPPLMCMKAHQQIMSIWQSCSKEKKAFFLQFLGHSHLDVPRFVLSCSAFKNKNAPPWVPTLLSIASMFSRTPPPPPQKRLLPLATVITFNKQSRILSLFNLINHDYFRLICLVMYKTMTR